MSRHPSLGAQLAAIKELSLKDVGRENFVDIHTWHTAACNGQSEHCDTSQFSDKIIERIASIYSENFD